MQKAVWTLVAGLLALMAFILGCGGVPGEREYNRGLREMERGNAVRAKALMEKSLTRRPGSSENASAYNYIGILSFRLGQVEQAKEAFEYSRRLDPAFADPTYNLGVLYAHGGDAPKAMALFQEAAAQNEQDPRALEYLGAMHLREGRWAEARRALFSALARAPQSSRILTSLALIDARTGNPGKASWYLMQALEKNPGYAPATYNLGVLYQRVFKDAGQAQAFYKRYLALEKSGPQAELARQALEDMSAESQGARPVEPAPAVLAAPVVATATPAPAARPPEPPAASDYLAEAKKAMDQGQVDRALALCLEEAARAERRKDSAQQEKALRAAAKLCFDQGRAHYELGRFLLDKGQQEAAIRSFKQALALDPKLTLAQIGLADAAIKTGEYDTALVTLKQVIQSEPANPDPLWAMAELYDRHLGVQDMAVQSYRQFERQFPGDPRVLKASARLKELAPVLPPETVRPATPEPEAPPPSAAPPASPPPPVRKLEIKKPVVRNEKAAVQAYNRGTVYQEKQDWDRAVYYYIRAVENDDRFAAAFYNLGTVYWAKRELELAQAAYQRAVEITSDNVNARFNLALVLKEMGRNSAAVEELKTIVRIEPGHAKAFYVLGLVYAGDPGAVKQARQAYERFLALAPEDPAAPIVRQWLKAH